ncbi:hypothetical protein MSAN_00361800 [Mycena sanguinolenta]|uniref:Trichothecene 3-O-acetyltransferase-like N-terminal domain-containing protein n=1 Tax=Mycena sanguinolenta TaxID=230812 RepID=A0A8H6Z911_9AGAR|nr:hypothetical protein MSAN_00361800 [Mycena sanguinolenta]
MISLRLPSKLTGRLFNSQVATRSLVRHTHSSLNDTLFIPGPSFHVELPPIDARHMFHFCRRLLFFRCTSDAQREAQLAALRSGIQALLARCPVLGGVVTPLPPDEAAADKENWRAIVPGRGIELVVRDLRQTMPTFTELEAMNFPPVRLPWALLMPISRDLTNDRPHAACKLQFSAIDGGTILTVAMSHCAADGVGTDDWMRILTQETRLAQESSRMSERPQGCDPGLHRKSEQAPSNVFGATSTKVPVLLRLSPAGAVQLKADATTPGERISTHDALCALMWRTVLLMRRRSSAQSIPLSATSNLFMPSDARRHLPDLPCPYVGNAVYQIIAALDVATLLSPSGLARAASEVRRAITAVTPSLVESYMTFIRDPIASRFIDYQFMNGSTTTTGFAMGTSLGSGDAMYGGDWGKAFGSLVTFRVVGEPVNTVLPKLPDGSIEAIVAVAPEDVETLTGVGGLWEVSSTVD